MGAALGWIGELVQWFSQFFPRLTWVPPTHGAITFTRGKKVRVYGPGLAGRWWWPMWWPFWTEMHTYPVVRQTHDMASQTLTTVDGETITVAGVIVYRIDDLEKALTSQWDLEDTIRDISTLAMAEFVTGTSFHDVQHEDGRALKTAIQGPLAQYGIGVEKAGIADFARTKHITIEGHKAVIEEE